MINSSLQISISDLITNFTSDPDGDLRTLVSVGAGTNGAAISVNGDLISYSLSSSNTQAGVTDQVEYVITDGFPNGLVTNQIFITLTNAISSPANLTGIMVVPAGIKVNFSGVPGYSYHIERTVALAGSNTVWEVVGSAIADNLSGAGDFTDTNAPPAAQAYYRTVWP